MKIETPKKITVALEHQELDGKRDPLGDLLEQALNVLRPSIPHRAAELWLSRWAIRAVCTAIIAEGRAVFPLEVKVNTPPNPLPGFSKMETPPREATNMQTIKINVPETFLRLCAEYYKVDAASLAGALAYTFCINPPEELTLISRTNENSTDTKPRF